VGQFGQFESNNTNETAKVPRRVSKNRNVKELKEIEMAINFAILVCMYFLNICMYIYYICLRI